MLDGLKSLNMHSLCDVQVIYFYALPEIFFYCLLKSACTSHFLFVLNRCQAYWIFVKYAGRLQSLFK